LSAHKRKLLEGISASLLAPQKKPKVGPISSGESEVDVEKPTQRIPEERRPGKHMDAKDAEALQDFIDKEHQQTNLFTVAGHFGTLHTLVHELSHETLSYQAAWRDLQVMSHFDPVRAAELRSRLAIFYHMLEFVARESDLLCSDISGVTGGDDKPFLGKGVPVNALAFCFGTGMECPATFLGKASHIFISSDPTQQHL